MSPLDDDPPDQPPGTASAPQIDDVPRSALCVYCRRQPIDPRWRPFCGERCRLQDLARWIDGDYRVAGEAISPQATRGDDELD